MKNNILDYNCANCNPEESLWKSVILQAFIDLKTNSKKKSLQNSRAKAMMWLNLNNKDFIEVCRNANLDPYYVWSKAKVIKDKILVKKMAS